MAYDNAQDFEERYISKSAHAPATVDGARSIAFASFPPLSQVTPVRNGDIAIVAHLTTSQDDEPTPWEVALWADVDVTVWRQIPLKLMEKKEQPRALQNTEASQVSLYYVQRLTFSTSVQFTFKYRRNRDKDWRWVLEEQGLRDGQLVIVPASPSSANLRDYVPDLNRQWNVLTPPSQVPQSQLWLLNARIGPADGETSKFTDIHIGTPWGSYLRWFALVRIWSPWLAPRQDRSQFSLEEDAILSAFLSPRGQSLVFLALSGVDDVLSVIRPAKDGGISAHVRNDALVRKEVTVLVAASNSFERAVAAVMYQARSHVSLSSLKTVTPVDPYIRKSIAAASEEHWYDGLGYCTWNALGQKLTEEKVLNAVETLAKNKIGITSFILDDNWQSIDYKGESQFQYGLLDFEAERDAFPSGLKATTARIRQLLPSIQNIVVWHALLGYWGGIAAEGKLAQTYKTVQVIREEGTRRNLPLGGRMTVIAKEDIARFYDDYYAFLSDAGVDAVKTDAQFAMDTWISAAACRELIKKYLNEWTIASSRYFDKKAISCMSQFPQALFHSQMPRHRPPLVVRNSDDFFPNIPSSHPWHVWVNAHNSIFTQHLNVLPDWDMCQTVHDYSSFHLAARCVSGGPIYITDVPGQHDMKLIDQITGTTTRGRTVIFRPSVLGKALHPYTCYDDNVLLKVGSFNGASETGTGILGIFNVSSRPLSELIPLSWFPGVSSAFDYVVRAHSSGKVSPPMNPGRWHSLTPVSLGIRGYEILCAFPLTAFKGFRHEDGNVASLGLVRKMTGCAAIVNSSIRKLSTGHISVSTRLKALGVLGVYISTLPSTSVNTDFMVKMHGQPVPRETVAKSKDDVCVLEVDVHRAWKALYLTSDVVEVVMCFSI